MSHKRSLRGAAALGLCVASCAVAGTAAAGNPHGTPPGQAQTTSASVQAGVGAGVQAGAGAGVSASAHGNAHAQANTHSTASAGVSGASHGNAASHTTAAGGANASVHGSASSHVHTTTVVHSATGEHLVVHPMAGTQTSGSTSTSTSGSAGATASAGAGASVAAHAHARGQLKQAARAGASGTSGATVHAQTPQLLRFSACTASPSQGMGDKPTSTTLFWTCAAATSNQTKLYGNALTAGQIAISRGGSGAMLVGPGNSQPHKVLACVAGKVHLVDVHAVKSYTTSGSCTSSASTPVVTGSTSPGTTVTASPTTSSSVVVTAAPTTTPTANVSTSAGVKGATNSRSSTHGRSGVQGAQTQGVLGAAASQQLPFTGLRLWIVALAAFGLLAGGLTLRRLSASGRAA